MTSHHVWLGSARIYMRTRMQNRRAIYIDFLSCKSNSAEIEQEHGAGACRRGFLTMSFSLG
jgi:hypothetical protein